MMDEIMYTGRVKMRCIDCQRRVEVIDPAMPKYMRCISCRATMLGNMTNREILEMQQAREYNSNQHRTILR